VWSEVFAAIGGLVAGSLGTAAGIVTALSRARASSNRGRPEALPYREVASDGPVVRCPDCDATVLKCTKCGAVRTDVCTLWAHCRENADVVGVWSETKEDHYLNFTHGTSGKHLCGPQRRVRSGFLWRNRCATDGLHVHQKCERCGWHGAVQVRSAHRDAPRPLPAEQNDLGSRQFVDHEEESHASGETHQQEP
jgi:hypothetical protein